MAPEITSQRFAYFGFIRGGSRDTVKNAVSISTYIIMDRDMQRKLQNTMINRVHGIKNK